MIYKIDRQRLQLEYERNCIGRQKGVLNWYISPDLVLHIYIDVFDVTYLYEVPVVEADPTLKMMLHISMSILGVVEPKKQVIERVPIDSFLRDMRQDEATY